MSRISPKNMEPVRKPDARTARDGMIEESSRRDLGLDSLAEIWAKVTPASEGEGLALAGNELRAIRNRIADRQAG